MILSIFGFAGGVGMPMPTSVNAQLGRRMGSKNKNGATGRDRTGYLHVTNVLLCQVSYSGPNAVYLKYPLRFVHDHCTIK